MSNPDVTSYISQPSKIMQTSLVLKSSFYLIGAVSLVTALSWNNLVKSSINKYFPLEEDSIKGAFIYALVMTLFLIMVVGLLPDVTNTMSKEHIEDFVEHKILKHKVDILKNHLPIKREIMQSMKT
jgi:uncharacterized membrane protein YagU involved in acid resistance